MIIKRHVIVIFWYKLYFYADKNSFFTVCYPKYIFYQLNIFELFLWKLLKYMLAEDFVFQTKKNILCFLYNLKSKIFFLELYLLYEENIENINPL